MKSFCITCSEDTRDQPVPQVPEPGGVALTRHWEHADPTNGYIAAFGKHCVPTGVQAGNVPTPAGVVNRTYVLGTPPHTYITMDLYQEGKRKTYRCTKPVWLVGPCDLHLWLLMTEEPRSVRLFKIILSIQSNCSGENRGASASAPAVTEGSPSIVAINTALELLPQETTSYLQPTHCTAWQNHVIASCS